MIVRLILPGIPWCLIFLNYRVTLRLCRALCMTFDARIFHVLKSIDFLIQRNSLHCTLSKVSQKKKSRHREIRVKSVKKKGDCAIEAHHRLCFKYSTREYFQSEKRAIVLEIKFTDLSSMINCYLLFEAVKNCVIYVHFR